MVLTGWKEKQASAPSEPQARPPAGHEHLTGVEVGAGEVDGGRAAAVDRHARGGDVALAGGEHLAGRDRGEVSVDDLLAEAQPPRDEVDEVDVEADHAAVSFELERGVRQMGAGGQHARADQAYALDGRAARGGAAGGRGGCRAG